MTGHFVLTTLWVGPSLYDGLSAEATGESDMTFFDRDNLLSEMTEYEVDREYRRRAWAFARENPGRCVQLAGVKLARFWKPWPNADQFGRPAAKLAVGGFFVPIVLLSIVGAFNVVRGRLSNGTPAASSRPADQPRCTAQCLWVLIFTAGPIFYFSALHMVFVSSLRYRLPAEYPLLVLAAIGLQSCWSGIRAKRTAPA